MEVIEEFSTDRRHRLIVLDEFVHRVIQNVEMELLFTQGCHHWKLSMIFIKQNIFPKDSKLRTIALNISGHFLTLALPGTLEGFKYDVIFNHLKVSFARQA